AVNGRRGHRSLPLCSRCDTSARRHVPGPCLSHTASGGLMAQTLGLIGLGIMGRPMAKNLLKGGYPLVVHSRSKVPVDDLTGAVEGTLSIMVGGDKPTFDLVLPIFQAMGKTITHLGPLGAGGFTKLANQIIVAVNLTALGEALTLARKAGLNRELTLKALGGGLAGSRCLEQKTPNYLSNTYNPGFRVDLHFKDLGLIMESGRALGVPLPTTALVQELFNALRVKGKGGLDHSGV